MNTHGRTELAELRSLSRSLLAASFHVSGRRTDDQGLQVASTEPGAGGVLIVVSTPIGNLDDLSPRAARVLREADTVAAEDTRRTGRLLAHIEADTTQVSYHDHNATRRIPDLLARLDAGQSVALVTDAGTPAVSDPGFRLVRACVEAGHRVEAVPGPSALLHALVVSGLPTDRFVFEGFLPRSGGTRRERLEDLATEQRTIVLYLSPHRVGRDLTDLADVLGTDREAALCRELTKLHEEVARAPLGALADSVRDRGIRGEVSLVVAGADAPPRVTRTPEEYVEAVRLRVAAGLDKKSAIAEVAAESAVPKREVYQAVVEAGGS